MRQEKNKAQKKGIFKKAVIICLAFLFSLGALITLMPADNSEASTDPLADYRAEQKRLQEEMNDQKKLINQQKQAIKDVKSEINDLDLEMDRLEKDMESANIQLQVLDDQLAEIDAQLTEAQGQLDERTYLMQNNLVNIYVNGDISFLDVLFESEDFSSFLINYDYYQLIMDQHSVLLAEIKEYKTLIEEQKALKEQRFNDLVELKQIKNNSITKLAGLQDQKAERLVAMDEDKAAAEKSYKEMEEASNEVASQIRQILAAAGDQGEFNGIFKWPLPGHTKITSEYGMRYHPILKKNKLHTGVDIGAPNGTKITAAEAGTVIFSGWNTAYGKMVIINHGGNVSSLYAHMSEITMQNGQAVAQGDKVGEVGSTGYSTGNHLHFEVRVNGNPVNPWSYLK